MRVPFSLLPSRQSRMQKFGFAFSLIACAVILFLHNPVGGYEWQQLEKRVTPLEMTEACPGRRYMELVEKGERKTLEERNEIFDLNRICWQQRSWEESTTAPFSEWRSRQALLPWFSSVVNTLSAMLLSLVAGAVLLWVFRPVSALPADRERV